MSKKKAAQVVAKLEETEEKVEKIVKKAKDLKRELETSTQTVSPNRASTPPAKAPTPRLKETTTVFIVRFEELEVGGQNGIYLVLLCGLCKKRLITTGDIQNMSSVMESHSMDSIHRFNLNVLIGLSEPFKKKGKDVTTRRNKSGKAKPKKKEKKDE